MNTKLKVGLGLLGTCAAGGVVAGGYFGFSGTNYSEFYINPVVDSPNGLVSAYNGARWRGAELILTPGFDHAGPIQSVFNEYPKKFKNTGFLLYDANVEKDTTASYNTWSITFRTDLGSIQVGIAIAYYLNYYQDWFADQDDGKLTWATWGGLPFSSVTSYMGGIQTGVKWANENLAGKTIHNPVSNKDFTYKEVIQVFDKNGNKEFTGGFGESSGYSIQQSIVNERPDMLIPVAGPQIWTAQSLIKTLKDSKTMLIGVDAACEEDARNENYPYTYHGKPFGNGKRVQFSSLKRLDLAGEKALKIINNGNQLPDEPEKEKTYNNFFVEGTGETGFGTCAVGNLENECVGISEEGKSFFDDALKLAGVSVDPATDPKYNDVANMVYHGPEGDKDYGTFDPSKGLYGLSQKCSLNVTDTSKILNKKGVIQRGNEEDAKKIKIVLSGSTSILMDASFSQSCYVGLYNYLATMDIKILKPAGSK